ncbi:hypothetical protein RI129_000621 [Pyrocoelia pectoralis]|uniref:DDE Tnp4 domain-containing protein n=1 Tax=Pyrocoelia pectoralis TaxID=417401 RepID=A0AAN7ZR31_9COLE
MSDSEEELITVGCLLVEEEETIKKRKVWVHNICKRRPGFSEFNALFPDLLEDEVKFFQYFRMSHGKFIGLLETLQPELIRNNTRFRRAVGTKERLAVTLSPCLEKFSLSWQNRNSTCEAIWTKLQPIVMPEPDEDMWNRIESEFYNKWNFPNLLGAIDGKHAVIQAPPNTGSQFFCYKKTFSIVCSVDVGACGRNSDGSIFKHSNFGKRLLENKFGFPPSKPLPGSNQVLPHVIIGDEAFPLCINLMRPYSRDATRGDEKKKVFNYRLSRARDVSENAFGILMKKFRIFEHRLCLSHDHINLVVLAACCLHNYLRNDICHWTESDLKVDVPNVKGLQNLQGIGGNACSAALRIRDEFTKYFNSPAGSVPWQMDKVRVGKHV